MTPVQATTLAFLVCNFLNLYLKNRIILPPLQNFICAARLAQFNHSPLIFQFNISAVDYSIDIFRISVVCEENMNR